MSAVNGRASVEIVADVSKFAAQLSRDLTAALKNVKIDASGIGDQISESVAKGVADAKKSLAELSETAAEKFREIPEDADESAKKTGDSFANLKTQMAVAGAAAAAAFAGAVAATLDKSRVDALVSAQLGATAEQAGRIGQLTGQIYAAGFGQDLPAVGAALRTAVQSGLVNIESDTDDTVKAVTQNLLTVGTVVEEDTSRVSQAVSQMLRTGLASSSEQAMDLIVAATQRGVNKSEDLLDVLNEYGTQFRALGIDGPTALGLMSQAIQAGARDADTAADALKEFAIRAIDGSDSSREAYEALGFSAEKMSAKIAKGGDDARMGLNAVIDRLREMKDPVERNAVAVGLFGTKAEDLGQALFAMDVGTAAAEMENFAGAAQRAGDTLTDSAGAKFDQFRRQAEMSLVEATVAVGEFIMENQRASTIVGGSLGAIALTIGVVSAAVKTWVTVKTIATVATKAWAAANTLLAGTFLLNPIFLIVVAVAALIAGLIAAYKYSETFRNVVDTAFRAVADAAIWLWDNALKPLWDGILVGVGWVVDAVLFWWNNAVLPYFTAIANIAMWLWNSALKPLWDGIVAGVGFVVDAVMWWWGVLSPIYYELAALVMWLYSTIFVTAFEGIAGAFNMLGTIVMLWWDNIVKPYFTAVANITMWLWNNVIAPAFSAIAGWFMSLGLAAVDLWNNWIAPAFTAIGGWFAALGRAAVDLWNWMQPALRAIGDAAIWLWGKIREAFGAMASYARDRINQIVATAQSIKSWVENVSSFYSTMIRNVRTRLDEMVNTVKGIPKRIASALPDLGSLLYNAGRNVINGLINGINSRLQALRNTIYNAAQSIRNALPFSPAKEGPLSGGGDPTIAGAKIAGMVAAGIDSSRGRLRAAGHAMADAVRQPLGGGGLDVFGTRIMSDTLATVPAPGGGAGSGGIVFEAGAITVTFAGVVPTEAEAYRTGQAVGAGVADALATRDMRATIRSL